MAVNAEQHYHQRVKQSVKTKASRRRNQFLDRLSLGHGFNPLRWQGLVPKSVALSKDNTNPLPYMHRRDRT